MFHLWKAQKVSESLLVAMLLAFVGGYLDIYTYLARGKVFANTQTGNLVLLGYCIAEGNTKKIVYYSLSILAFSIGILITKLVEQKFHEKHEFLWLHITLGIEMAALFIVMFIPNGKHDVLANIMIAFVCAIQVQSFRKVNGNSYSTTMFTGNLKNAAERLSHYLFTKDVNALENGTIYTAVIAMFVLGAGIGDLLTNVYKNKAVGFVELILAIVFLLLFFDNDKNIPTDTV